MSTEQLARIDDVARAQHGLLTAAQADKVLGPRKRRYWLEQGRLVAVQPGVYRLAGTRDTWHQAVLAAALSTGGVVSHRSAAEVWGLIQPAGYVEVSVAANRAPKVRPPAVVHRIEDLHPELGATREGLRLTDPVRTIIDLGLVLPRWSVGDALSRGLTTRLFTLDEVQHLRDALGRPGRNGTGVVRSLLEDRALVGGRDESVLEARFAELVLRQGLPVPAFQHEVWHNGRFMARIDAAYPELRLAIEVDGYLPHASPDAFQRDRTRQNRLVALGWTVLRFTWADIVHDPTAVAQAVRDMIRQLTPAA